MIGWRAFYRIDSFNGQLHAFGGGQLGSRLSVNGNGDELDELAKGVNDTLERVEQLMASLKQVSSDIAHDLRTPLARLRQRLEEASLDSISREDFTLVLDDARERVDNILSTFTALLGIAQIESGTLREKFTSIDLSELCQSVVEAYRAAFENEGRHINVAIESGVKIYGDRNLITQVLANLLENVLRHTSTGTSMSLRLFAEGQTATLKIRDNGPGIPEAEKEKIFRRFYRLERSRTSPGNGLGLSLVKAVVDLHSAYIRLDAPSSGLETTIQFPALSPPAS
ncbi:MAG: HAMP domain-containing sensor histidine kinase [Parvibaculum sp.]|nr:HAMP domain-containing sensor histidine kinase [Parvibaculum sp.]